MANTKPTFAKLKLQKNTNVKTITFNDFEIEIKQYLPVNDKLALIGKVLNQASDEQNYSNPIKEDIFGTLEIIYAYTNISFTEKQKEDPCGLYDILVSSGLADMIIDAIPTTEYKAIVDGINACGKAIYTYRNSAMGILDIIGKDYSSLEYDAANIQSLLGDPNSLELLKDVLTKLG
jgi:hypothetical protein